MTMLFEFLLLIAAIWAIPNYDIRYGSFYGLALIAYWFARAIQGDALVGGKPGSLTPQWVMIGLMMAVAMWGLSITIGAQVLGSPVLAAGPITATLLAGIVGPIENRFFIGTIQETARKFLPGMLKIAAIIGAGLIATYFHIDAYGLSSVAFLFCFMIFSVWGIFYTKTKNMWAIDVAHSLWNMMITASATHLIVVGL